MRFGWMVLALLSACGFSANGGHGGDGGPPDDAPSDGQAPDGSDGMVEDAPSGAQCFGHYRVACVLVDAQPLDVNTALMIDTTPVSGSALCQSPIGSESTVGDVCVIARSRITLNAVMRAYGSRPLVLVAQQTLTINSGGVIDVSSKSAQATDRGAGARTGCSPMTAPAGNTGGGAGGSHGDIGGTGGQGGAGGNGAVPTPAAAFNNLIGGCNGTDGAFTTTADRGKGGPGGGALLVIAASMLINGDINASGARGTGADKRAGGGGGGAGGAIVLDGDFTINTGGRVWAQGAGGGEGGGSGMGNTVGSNGQNPNNPGVAANGGDGASSGGPGGSGGLDGPGMSPAGGGNDGGGGGGGGVGFIRYTAMLPTLNAGSVVHPPPLRLP